MSSELELQPIADDTDLSPVFGELAGDDRAQLVEQLRAADARLRSLCERLGDGWTTAGLELQTLLSGQASFTGVVKHAEQQLSFGADLRPGNYFSDHDPWRPGQPPRPMQTDAWDVEGAVVVVVRRHLLNKKYALEETVAETPSREFATPAEAVAGLAAAIDELFELALSREPTAAAWAPAED